MSLSSLQRNKEELDRLVKLADQFQKMLKRTVESARFRVTPERSTQFVAHLRQAQGYLELAMTALDLTRSTLEVDSNWLSDRVASLVNYLTKGESADKPLPASPETSRTSAGISGDCNSLSIPDLLSMLQVQKKTGVLRIQHASETIVLHLDGGDLVHAYSENTPSGCRLGEILVRQGALTEDRLDSILFCHGATPRKMGDILLEGDVVTEAQLTEALEFQVQQLTNRMFVMRDARFRFEPGLPPVDDEVDEDRRGRLNLIQLLLESARVHDEEEQARGELEEPEEPKVAEPEEPASWASALDNCTIDGLDVLEDPHVFGDLEEAGASPEDSAEAGEEAATTTVEDEPPDAADDLGEDPEEAAVEEEREAEAVAEDPEVADADEATEEAVEEATEEAPAPPEEAGRERADSEESSGEEASEAEAAGSEAETADDSECEGQETEGAVATEEPQPAGGQGEPAEEGDPEQPAEEDRADSADVERRKRQKRRKRR